MNTGREQCIWLLEQLPEHYIDTVHDYLSKQVATCRYTDATPIGTATLEGWQAVLRAVREEAQKEVDWSLTADQAFYMLSMNNLIEAWDHDDKDAANLVMEMAASKEFADLFGNLSFDEARDRYEWMLEHGAKITS